jgi:uncharacterized membrane protein
MEKVGTRPANELPWRAQAVTGGKIMQRTDGATFANGKPWGNWRWLLLLGLVLALGAFLRFYDLGGESYWFDELQTVFLAGKQALAQAIKERGAAYMVLAHYWVRVFGVSEVATRSLSALLGIVSLGLAYVISSRLFNHRVALVSTFVMAISEFQIHYSQDFRYYMPMMVATLVSYLLFLRVLERPSLIRWAFYGLAGAIMVYFHSYGLFTLVAHNLYVALRWKKHRALLPSWLLTQSLIALAVVPVIIPDLVQSMEGAIAYLEWIPAPSWKTLLRTLYWYMFPLRHQRSWTSLFSNLALGIAFFVAGMGLYMMRATLPRWWAKVKRHLQDKRDWLLHKDTLLLLGLWLLCPILIPFLISKIAEPMYQPRYTIGAAAALYILTGFAIIHFRDVIPPFVVLATLVILIGPGLYHYYKADVKEQWDDVSSYIEANGQAGDVIAFLPDAKGWHQKTFDFYYAGALPTCSLAAVPTDAHDLASHLATCADRRDRVWLVSRYLCPEVEQKLDALLVRGDTNAFKASKIDFVSIFVYLVEF